MVLDGQPEPPKYFAEMKRLNKNGPRRLHGLRRPERLPLTRLDGILESGQTVVDTRRAADFAAEHIPGTINIALNKSFNTWAGWLLPFDRDFYLIIDDQCAHCVDEAVRDLSMIGLDRVAGYFGTGVLQEWTAAGRDVASVPQITSRALAERVNAGDVAVLDVRSHAEWESGHIPGVENIPAGYLPDRLDEVARDKPLVVHCQTGARSAIAASVLQANGRTNVINLTGGFADWQNAGLPVERGEGAENFAGAS